MKKTSLHACLLLFLLAVLASLAVGQTIPGTLTYTEKITTYTVPSGDCAGAVQHTDSYYWTFTDPSGGAHSFPNPSVYFYEFYTNLCKFNEYFPADEWSSDGLYYLQGTSGSATEESVTLAGGYLNPKYLIMGVTYAPPGGNAQSYVSYGTTDFVGNTSMNSSLLSGYFVAKQS
jgi:hypothetical protein